MNYCDEIWWIVDIFGLTDILEKYFMTPGYTVTANKRDGSPGLIFFKGHWKYKSSSGKVYDSYKMKYQIDGTAHFCQSFALLQYLKDVKPSTYGIFAEQLRPEQYAHNIRVIISMWRFIFKQKPELLKIYVHQVKILHTIPEYLGIYHSHAVDIDLNKMTQKKFLEMLDFIDEHAQKIVGCREG